MTNTSSVSRSTAGQIAPIVHADVDAVVLDIDDTLYLERDYVRSGFNAVGAWAKNQFGLEDFAARAWAAFEAGNRGHIFDDVLTSYGRQYPRSVVDEMIDRYRIHDPVIDLAPDVQVALDSWNGVLALAAITDGPLASQKAKSRALALDTWIQHIIFTAELGAGKGKPHRAAFELVQNRSGAEGSRCVYIADNPAKDFIAPKNLGWRTIRIRRPLGLHAEVPSGPDVDCEITSFDQLDLQSRSELAPTERRRSEAI